MDKKIYEKHFADIDEILEKEDEDSCPIDSEAGFKDLMKSIQEDYAYVLIPNRIANKQRFIQAVKAFSEQEQLNVEIIERDFEIVAHFDLDMLMMSGERKKLLQYLLSVTDEIEYVPFFDAKQLTLTYYTHEKFYKGKKQRNIQ